jgi:hypothetical protein
MKFKILIDKSTIKENPAAGSTELVETLPKTTNFLISGRSKNIATFMALTKNYNTAINTDSNYNFSAQILGLSDGEAYIVNDWIKRNKDIIETVNIETKNNLIKHQTMPQPQYSFEYQPTLVECDSCGAKFNHKWLKNDYDDGSECNLYNICPVCDESSCCEIEYQGVEEALKEGALK